KAGVVEARFVPVQIQEPAEQQVIIQLLAEHSLAAHCIKRHQQRGFQQSLRRDRGPAYLTVHLLEHRREFFERYPSQRLDQSNRMVGGYPLLRVNHCQHRSLWPIMSTHLPLPPQPNCPRSTIQMQNHPSIPIQQEFLNTLLGSQHADRRSRCEGALSTEGADWKLVSGFVRLEAYSCLSQKFRIIVGEFFPLVLELVDAMMRRGKVHFSSITKDLLMLVLWFVVVMVVLYTDFGVQPLSILTTTTVFAAVLGFALQETLGNIFSGLSLSMGRPFEPGDWVRSGQHVGRVKGIAWRATTIVTRANERLEIPNSVIAKDVLFNY